MEPTGSTSCIHAVPDHLTELSLALLCARDLAAAACASRHFSSLVTDQLWAALLIDRLPRLVRLLDAAAPAPDWWAERSWRQRLRSLVADAPFAAQVFNRELENEAEDFLLSSYDATCSLAPASAAALLSSRRAGAAGQPLAAGTAGSSQLVFCARYLPIGAMKAAEETGVAPERLRLPPPGSSPCEVYGGGTAASAGLCVGEEVEVQWKGRRSHPFGWWFGTVQSARGNRITLMFRQYPRSSVWHRVKAPIKAGQEAVVNGDFSFGYVGGLRRLTAEERDEWRRHGAPQPPSPGQLAALEAEAAAAAEEEWSDEEGEEEDEELDIDADLAAELEGEHELEDEAAAAPLGDTAAGGGGGAAEAGAQAAPPAAGDASHAAAAAEDAANGPAHPPAEPIAMQLGATGGAGQPVALAGGPTPPAGAAQ